MAEIPITGMCMMMDFMLMLSPLSRIAFGGIGDLDMVALAGDSDGTMDGDILIMVVIGEDIIPVTGDITTTTEVAGMAVVEITGHTDQLLTITADRNMVVQVLVVPDIRHLQTDVRLPVRQQLDQAHLRDQEQVLLLQVVPLHVLLQEELWERDLPALHLQVLLQHVRLPVRELV